MEKNKSRLFCVALVALLFSSLVLAQSPLKYIQFTFAPYDAQSPGIQYPIFIFQQLNNGQWTQVGYVPDQNKNIYVGPIKSKQKLLFKVATAQLTKDQTAVKSWTSGCEVAIQHDIITTNTCLTGNKDSIVSLDTQDAKKGANYATLSFSANEMLPALPNNALPSSYYLPSNRRNRLITFYNLTNYPEIGLSDTRSGPNYKTVILSQGNHYSFAVPADQRGDSLSWAVTGYSTIADCQPGEACWINSGNYFNAPKNAHVYATKIEGTIPSVEVNSYGLNSVANANIDLSAVDGFNFKMILVPTELTYCTKNPPSQWSKANSVPFVNQFSPRNPLAEIPRGIKKHHHVFYPKLQSICSNISNAHFIARDLRPSAYIANLFANDQNNLFSGCLSPCAYATQQVAANNSAFIQAFSASGNGNHVVDRFCCSGAYGTKSSCDAAGFVNATTYVRMLDGSDGVNAHASQANFKNTYSYQFDDPNANLGCPGNTNYHVYIFNGTQKPAIIYLTKPNKVWVNPGKTSVKFGWHAPLDSQKNPNINYQAVVMQNGFPVKNGFCDRAFPEHICYLPKGTLKTNTAYELKITAVDGENAIAESSIVHFATHGGKIQPFSDSPEITSIAQDGLNALLVQWSQAHDANNLGHTPISYVLTVMQIGNPEPIAQETIQNPAQLGTVITNLGLINVNDVVSIQAQDSIMHNGSSVLHQSASAVQNFVVGSIIPAVITSPISNVTSTTASIYWTAAKDLHFNPRAKMDYHVLVTPNVQNGTTMTFDAGSALNFTLTGLSPNTTYNVQVSASDSMNDIAAMSTLAQFMTN